MLVANNLHLSAVLLLLIVGTTTFGRAAYCGGPVLLTDEPWLDDTDYAAPIGAASAAAASASAASGSNNNVNDDNASWWRSPPIVPWSDDSGAAASASASAGASEAVADASAAASTGEQLLARPISQLVADATPSGDAGAIFDLATGIIGDYLPVFNQFGSFVRASANTLAATSWLAGDEPQRVLGRVARAGDTIAAVSAQTSLNDVLRSADATADAESNAALALGLAQNVLTGLQPYVPEFTFQGVGGGCDDTSALEQAQQLLLADD